MKIVITLLAAAALVTGIVGCGADDERASRAESTASTENLHEPCTGGCATGQQCIVVESGPNKGGWCEIPCDSDPDCPSGLKCRLPPALPDTLLNVCE